MDQAFPPPPPPSLFPPTGTEIPGYMLHKGNSAQGYTSTMYICVYSNQKLSFGRCIMYNGLDYVHRLTKAPSFCFVSRGSHFVLFGPCHTDLDVGELSHKAVQSSKGQ